jgi:cytochrome bd-type quinol oxidase subunit 1
VNRTSLVDSHLNTFLENEPTIAYTYLVTPKALLGRMNASMKWVMLIGMPLGAVVGSIIAERFGLQAALYASAIGIIVGPIPLFFSGIASVVRQPEHSEE